MKLAVRLAGCGCLTVIVVLLPLGAVFPAELVIYTLFGWAWFLYRVAPQVKVAPDGVLVALICLAGFSIGLHLFLVWLVQNWGLGDAIPVPRIWRRRWTAALVSVVILLFISGIAATGIVHQAGWLISSKEPLTTFSAKLAANHAASMNNLKQIGVSIEGYERSNQSLLPGAFFDRQGTPFHGWMTALLPHLEQQKLYDRIEQDQPWDAPVNVPLFQTRVYAFMQPAIRRPLEQTGFAPADYAGNALILGGDHRATTASIVDGKAFTILAGEVVEHSKAWGDPTNWRDVSLGINKHPAGFGSPSPGGASFLFADGQVRFIKNTIDSRVLKALSTPNGSETIVNDSF